MQTRRILLQNRLIQLQNRRIQLQNQRIQLQTGRTQLQYRRIQLQTGRIQSQRRRIQLQKPVIIDCGFRLSANNFLFVANTVTCKITVYQLLQSTQPIIGATLIEKYLSKVQILLRFTTV